MQYKFAMVTSKFDVLVLTPSFEEKLIALNGGKDIKVDGVNMSKYLETGEFENKSAVVDFSKMKENCNKQNIKKTASTYCLQHKNKEIKNYFNPKLKSKPKPKPIVFKSIHEAKENLIFAQLFAILVS